MTGELNLPSVSNVLTIFDKNLKSLPTSVRGKLPSDKEYQINLGSRSLRPFEKKKQIEVINLRKNGLQPVSPQEQEKVKQRLSNFAELSEKGQDYIKSL